MRTVYMYGYVCVSSPKAINKGVLCANKAEGVLCFRSGCVVWVAKHLKEDQLVLL